MAAVIAVSRFTAEALMRRYPELRGRPPHVVYPGIDVARFAALPRPAAAADGRLRLACVSRLSEEKGVDVLLRALAIARRHEARISLQICGDGDERATLEALAAELELRAHVIFLGRLEDVSAVLAGADVLVIPSRSENLPLAVLEALAAGLPVVASDVGGLSEIVRPGHTGWLVPPEDPEQLADTLSCVGDSSVMQKMSANARLTAAAYDQSRMAKRVHAIYRYAHPE